MATSGDRNMAIDTPTIRGSLRERSRCLRPWGVWLGRRTRFSGQNERLPTREWEGVDVHLGYPLGVAPRECPNCGRTLKSSIEHLSLMPNKPAIAALRWDCESCGWSLTFDPRRGRDTDTGTGTDKP